MADIQTRDWLEVIMAEEVLTAFPDTHDAPTYWAQCRDRFANPYLDHRIADIAQNHAAKIERRVKGFLQWAGETERALGDCPRLRAAFSKSLGPHEERQHAD